MEFASNGCGFEGGAKFESVVEVLGYLHVRWVQRIGMDMAEKVLRGIPRHSQSY